MSRLSLIVGVVGLLLALLLVDVTGRASELGLFVGRFHPTIVHFPIALLLVAAAIEVLVWRGWLRKSAMARSTPGLLFVATWTAIAAAIAGLFLAQGGGYDLGLFSWHQRLGIVTAVTAAFAYFWRTRESDRAKEDSNEGPGTAYMGLIGLVVVAVAVTGHLGGMLTHGEGYLTRHAPDPLRRVVGLPPKADLQMVNLGDPVTATVFESIVRPVLNDKCVACHNAAIDRGGLALDSPESIQEGGEDGPVIAEGQSSESELVKRIWLPVTDHDHMPPAHRPQITVAEAELIRWWIDNGASFDQAIADTEPNPAIEAIFESWGMGSVPTGVFALEVPMADTMAISRLRAAGMRVSRVAESLPFLQARCADAANCLTPPQQEALAALADQLIWLDVARTQVDDNAVRVLERLPHITRLHLENTAVSDSAVTSLRGMEYLAYLNLYGTNVTDAAVDVLETLPALESVYLWQTRVTAGRADRFRSLRPGVEVNLGEDDAASTEQ